MICSLPNDASYYTYNGIIDIDIPKQFEMTEEDDEAQDPCLEEKLEDVWDELCLDQFLDTLNQNHGSSTSNNTNGAASQAAAVATGRSPVRNT